MYVYTLPRRIVSDIVKTLKTEANRQNDLAGNGQREAAYYPDKASRDAAAQIAIELEQLAQEIADSLALVVVSPRTD